MFAGSEEVSRTIPEVTARAIPILEEAGDDVGLARAWRLRGEMAGLAAHWGERAEALERAVEHARLAGDLREEATLVAFLAFSLYYGPTPVEEAIARCERFLEEVTGDRSLEAAIENVLAGLRAMLGEFDEARRLWLRASSQYEELGLSFRRAARSLIAAGIEILADDYGAAERELRWAYETLEAMGDKGARAPIAAYLGEVLYAAGPARGGRAVRRRSPTIWLPQTMSYPRRSGAACGQGCSQRRGELEEARGAWPTGGRARREHGLPRPAGDDVPQPRGGPRSGWKGRRSTGIRRRARRRSTSRRGISSPQGVSSARSTRTGGGNDGR